MQKTALNSVSLTLKMNYINNNLNKYFMKTVKLLALLSIFNVYGLTSFAQVQKVKAGYGVSVAQTEPEYPGGLEALKLFLHENMKYPTELMASRTGGSVSVIFIIDKEGKIVDPMIMKGVNDLLNAEALRLVKLMPDWKPGTVGGNPVNKQYILPINFVIPTTVI